MILSEKKIPTKESIRSFTDEFKKQYDRLDIVCNNAGVMGFLVLQNGISQKVLDAFRFVGLNTDIVSLVDVELVVETQIHLIAWHVFRR